MELLVARTPLPTSDLEADWRYFSDIEWFVLSDRQGTWIGYAGLQFNLDFPEVYMGPSFIKPEYRGNNLQQALLYARELYAQQKGYSVLTSCCYPDNIASIKNLLACGYEIVISNEKEVWVKKCLNSFSQ